MTTTPVREIQGELRSFPLMELVPVLGERQASGRLVLARGALRRSFELVEGAAVRASSNDPREYLGQVLVDFGLANSLEAARLFGEQESTRVPLGMLLEQETVLGPEGAREALKLKIRESMLDAFRWEHGEVHFVPGTPPPRGVDVAVRLAELHREANGRAREWAAIHEAFPSHDARLEAVPGAAPEGPLPPEQEVLLEMARERRTVAEALDAFRDGELRVYRRLLALLRSGVIAVEPSAGRVQPGAAAPARAEEARRLLAAGRIEEAADVAALAAEHGEKEAVGLLRLAQTELTLCLADKLLTLEGMPFVRPRDRALAALDLGPAELHLVHRISLTRSLREAIRSAPMGELEALRIVERLVARGVIGFTAR